MKLSKILFFILCVNICCLLIGCSQSTMVLCPAQIPHTYLPKETIVKGDSIKYKSKFYISGSANTISHNTNSVRRTYNSNQVTTESITRTTDISSFYLQANHSNSWKYFNIAYGLKGALGNFNYATNDTARFFIPKGRQNFYYFSSNLDIDIKVPLEDAEWRILGLSLGYSQEGGKYLDLKRSIRAQEYLAFSPSNYSYFYAIGTEICTKNNKFFFKGSFIRNYIPNYYYFADEIQNVKNIDLQTTSFSMTTGGSIHRFMISGYMSALFDAPILQAPPSIFGSSMMMGINTTFKF